MTEEQLEQVAGAGPRMRELQSESRDMSNERVHDDRMDRVF